MIPFPALGGALMDAHDRCETVDRNRASTLAEAVEAGEHIIATELDMAISIGWSRERVESRGCQLWGELRGDDRYAEVVR